MKTRTKFTLAVTTLLATVTLCSAQGYHYVRPYYRQDGTPVRGHYQTNPDRNPYNNWSYPGNENPFHPRRSIHTMPRGYGGGLDPDSGLNLDLD